MKLNVDGSSLGNPGKAGFGGLFRNSNGEWLAGFSGSCGISSNLKAELLVIAHGLDLAWNAGYKDVICESYSKVALSLIEEGVQQSHPYAPIVDHIRKFVDFPWHLVFHHTLREGNQYADWLAKFGANMVQNSITWSGCPPHHAC